MSCFHGCWVSCISVRIPHSTTSGKWHDLPVTFWNGIISHPCLVLSSITLLHIHESTYTTCQTLGGSRGVSESSLSPQRWSLLWSWSWISCVPVCFAIGKKEASSSALTESPGMKWNTASCIFLRYPRCNSMVHILSQLLFSCIAISFPMWHGIQVGTPWPTCRRQITVNTNHIYQATRHFIKLHANNNILAVGDDHITKTVQAWGIWKRDHTMFSMLSPLSTKHTIKNEGGCLSWCVSKATGITTDSRLNLKMHLASQDSNTVQ